MHLLQLNMKEAEQMINKQKLTPKSCFVYSQSFHSLTNTPARSNVIGKCESMYGDGSSEIQQAGPIKFSYTSGMVVWI